MMNDLRFEQADDRLGEGVIVAVPAAADGGLDAGGGQALRVSNTQILTAAVAVIDQLPVDFSVVQCLLKCIEVEVGAHRRRYPPAHDAPREHIDDEGDVDEATPRGHVREVGDPELNRALRAKRTVYQIPGPLEGRLRDGGAHSTLAYHAPMERGV